MDVRQVAKLAHLEITDEEVALYTPQMAEIVAYVEQLNELDTSSVEPMLGGLTKEGEATFAERPDVPHASLGQENALRRSHGRGGTHPYRSGRDAHQPHP